MAGKTETIATLEAAFERFRSAIADLPDSAWHEVWLGTWSLDKLLAHMTGWWGEMTPAIERVGRGERPVPEGVDYSDPEPFNARFAATASPGKHALAIWEAAFRRYAEAARALGDEFYGENEQGRPRIGNRLLDASGIGHFAEHQPELDAWLAGRG